MMYYYGRRKKAPYMHQKTHLRFRKGDLLAIGFVLGVNKVEMQRLLRIAHRAFLNTTQLRDACILRGLDGGLSLEELNGLLAQEGHAPLY